MQTLWFCVPANGRAKLARVCLRQLRRTCDALADHDIEATAVVIADDENLDTAAELGFATVRRDNRFLSAKYNDGIQLALDERFNPRPADFVVPCGSDDWIDHRILIDLPTSPDTIHCFQRLSFVREDGVEMRAAFARNLGGCGIRVYPRHVMQMPKHLHDGVAYRPADEDRRRACDTSILVNLTTAYRIARKTLTIVYADQHDRQIVDWKSAAEQINPYGEILTALSAGRSQPVDPFDALADVFPAESLEEMRAVNGRPAAVAA
jgi:glycosyltransferase involved in cell wall biosynthesis